MINVNLLVIFIFMPFVCAFFFGIVRYEAQKLNCWDAAVIGLFISVGLFFTGVGIASKYVPYAVQETIEYPIQTTVQGMQYIEHEDERKLGRTFVNMNRDLGRTFPDDAVGVVEIYKSGPYVMGILDYGPKWEVVGWKSRRTTHDRIK